MKSLYLCRHGDAEENGSVSDYNRELTGKGEERTAVLAGEISKTGLVPDIVISSGARRAVSTASIIAGMCGYPLNNIMIEDILYYSRNGEDILPIVIDLPENVSIALIVGHNPLLSGFVLYLCGFSGAVEMKKSSVVRIDFTAEKWDEVKPGSGKVISYREF